MSISIAICDDNKVQVELIASYLQSFKFQEKIVYHLYYNGEDLYQGFQKINYDIVFLDIEMGGLNGIEIGRKIRELDKRVLLVYLTGYKEYALEAFEIQSFHYLIKPITNERFNKLMEQLIKRLAEIRLYQKEKKKSFVFKAKDQLHYLNTDEIIYFEKKQRKIVVNTTTGSYEYFATTKQLLEELNPEDFIQCHQGFIINLNRVSRLAGNIIYLKGYDDSLPVSRRFKKNVLLAIEKKLFRE